MLLSKSKRNFLGAMSVSILSLALVSCGSPETTESAPAVSKTATTTANVPSLELEKDELKFGFIKLTDMAPLAIAYEKGYFEKG